MKYGKEFQHILDASDFPDDWKTNAIEYRKLKKLIKNVVSELEGMGLPPAVLNRLLVAQPDNDTGESTPISEDFEFEFEIDGGASPKQVLVDPVVDDPHRFRLRMVSDPPDESPESPSPRPIGVTEMLRTRSEGSESRRVVAGSNVTASYVLTGDDANPVPQIRLVVSNLESEDDVAEEHGVEIPDIPPSPSLPNIRKVASPIWALASAGNTDGLVELSLGDAAERQFIIPLQSDVAFFNVLTAALKSLSAFHTAQQENFTVAVRGLCDSISQSIQPGDRPIVLPLNATDTPRFEYAPPASMSQKDLYAWRDIFSLWIEAQIFESSAERDRGERTVEEAERRLKLFANEVVKRGLGDRRSFKGKRTRKAWDEFLRLNVLLLDLKRFQTANISAARKILKKHDKRTALTATVQSSALDGNVWRFYNTSLPHVLLASMTDTLLPILPSLDDYVCLICMSIAFKPIRLSCGHLFCIRCLVKMQQRRKEQCPLCRAPSVLLADKSCLDTALMTFMRDWFPKEVKEKSRENSAEVAKEQLQDAGFDTRCCIM